MNKRYKYQEIAERIKMDIFANHQAPNKSIPSIREYAEGNQGNPHTVACALRLLMEEGIRGKGIHASGGIHRKLHKVLYQL